VARRDRTQYEITALDRTRAAVRSASDGFRGLDGIVGKLGINFSLMGAAGGLAPGLIVAAAAPAIDRLGKLSESTGIAVGQLQAMEDASARAGIEVNKLAGSLKEGLKRISESAGGMGEAGKILDELGLSAKDLKQQSPEKQIELILEALEDVDNVGDRIKFADKIFGGQGVDLIRLTNDAIKDAADELEAFNLTLTETDVSAVETMNDELQRTQRIGVEASKVFTSELAPAITAVTRQALGLGSGFLDARSAGTLMADGIVTGLGFVGDTVNDVRRAVRGMEFVFQAAGVSILETFDKIPGIDLTSKIEEEQAKADVIFGKLNQILGPNEFSDGLTAALAAARAEAAALAEQIEKARASADGKPKPSTSSGGNEGDKGDDGAKGGPKLFNTTAEEIEKQVDAQINAELAAEAALEEARARRREDFRTLSNPLSSSSDGSDLGDLEERLTRERDVIAEQYEEKRALLSELAANDESIARDGAAIEQEIFRDKERAMTQLALEGARERTQIQRDAAFGLFNIAATGVASLIKNEEKAKRFQQGISKARALMAGVEAAEKARAFGATLGGLAGGSLAYGLSWAATLASVATIDSAANGGGGSGGGAGAVASGTGSAASTNTSQIRTTAAAPAQSVNVYVLSADEIIDNEKLADRINRSIASSSRTRGIVIDPKTLRINYNGEAA